MTRAADRACEPVNDTIATSGCATQRLAGHPARAGDDVDHAVGEPGLVRGLGEQQRGQRGELGGLEHDRVAGRDRRQDLPRRHLQRVVPRRDRADDTDRPRAGSARCGRPEYSPAALPSRSRAAPAKNDDVVDRARARRTRGVSRIGLPVCAVSTWAQVLGPLARAAPASRCRAADRSAGVARDHCREGGLGRRDRRVDVLRAGQRDAPRAARRSRGRARRGRPRGPSTGAPAMTHYR